MSIELLRSLTFRYTQQYKPSMVIKIVQQDFWVKQPSYNQVLHYTRKNKHPLVRVSWESHEMEMPTVKELLQDKYVRKHGE